jgi:hypothetical protein
MKFSKEIMAKIFLLATAFLWICGCAHTPIATKPLIESQKISEKKTIKLNLTLKDEREERFKTEGYFAFDNTFLTGSLSFGDLKYDAPLYSVFEKMFIRRFGNSPGGHNVEIKLKAFYHIYKLPSIAYVPVLGILANFVDAEYHGILKAEVAFLDQENKFIFHKIYDVDLMEMKKSDEVDTADLDMYIKEFNKFAEEFETDISRIKF